VLPPLALVDGCREGVAETAAEAAAERVEGSTRRRYAELETELSLRLPSLPVALLRIVSISRASSHNLYLLVEQCLW